MVINAKGPANLAEKYLVKSIWENKFPPGTLLPAERELSEIIGVTRTTLREVLQRLARDGWITIHHGKPTKVNNIWETSSLNILETVAELDPKGLPVLIDQLLETRMNLSHIYFERAIRKNPQEVIDILDKVTLLEDNSKEYTNFDYNLHRSIALLAGNPIYVLIINGFNSLYNNLALYYFSKSECRLKAYNYYREMSKLILSKNIPKVLELIHNNDIETKYIWNSLST